MSTDTAGENTVPPTESASIVQVEIVVTAEAATDAETSTESFE